MNKQMAGSQDTQGKLEKKLLGTKKLPLLLLLLGTFFIYSTVFADSISTTDKYAWSENTGWLNFNSTHEAVTVFDDHLEGYVWAENIGWIRLGTHTGGGSFSYTNSLATNYGVNNDGSGNLSGYGWGENIGWVNFNPTHSQVTINATTGDFDGYAWAENIGWIHFNHTIPAYKVSRQLVLVDTTPDAFAFSDQSNVALASLITSNAISVNGINSNSAISIVGGEYEINNSGTWLTTASSVSNGNTIKVRHTSAGNYSSTVNTILTIGGVSDTFSSTTLAAPAPPPPPAPVTHTKTVSHGGVTMTLSVQNNILSQASLETLPDDVDAGIHFPFGLLAFQSTSVIGGSVKVELCLNQNLPTQGFFLYKFDNEHKRQFIPQDFWQQSSAKCLELTLKDGGLFDLDGRKNGVIIDPIAIGEPLNEPMEAFTFSGYNDATAEQWVSSKAIPLRGIRQMTTLSIDNGLLSIDGAPFQSEPVSVGLGQSIQVLIPASAIDDYSQTATIYAEKTGQDYQTDFVVHTLSDAHNEQLQYAYNCSEQATEEVIKAYLANYVQLAHTAQINTWACLIQEQGGGFAAIAEDFSDTPAFNERFAGMSETQIIADIYQKLFHRTPTSDEQATWLNALNQAEQTIATLAMAILESATGNDQGLVQRQLDLAHYYYEQYGQNDMATRNFTKALALISAQSSSLEEAKKVIDQQVNLMILAKIPEQASEVYTTVTESNSNYINYFLLAINKKYSHDISVFYETVEGTARAGKDYIASSGRAIIRAGELATAIPVTIIGDYKAESSEYFYLRISQPEGTQFAKGVTEIESKRIIEDDD